MCGIAGFTANPNDGRTPAILHAMTDALAHRGPDGAGHAMITRASGSEIALGHRRLSIIDLATGDQPLWLDGDAYAIVFNGEIYNYVELREELKAQGASFHTTSDTEVLLRAYAIWGEAAFSRFRGMFAVAIWDKARDRLILARDHFGKKPLFTARSGGHLIFASEIAAMVAHPSFKGTIDYQALARYLIWKYVPGPGTLLHGITEIPPGCYAIWQNGQLDITQFYSVPVAQNDPARQWPDTDATVAGFRAKLEEAVTLRLRSDVPLGAFLSGGIDSSTIVALMAAHTNGPVRTFSIGFHEETYSELWAARLVAERFKTDHHELKIAPETFMDQLEAVTWQRGAPLSEMADMPVYALSHMAAEHVKVVLSGEGADELLGGYPKHGAEKRLGRMLNATPAAVLNGVSSLAQSALPYRARRLAILARVLRERDFTARQAAWFGLMPHSEAARLCPSLFADYTPFEWDDDLGPGSDPVARALRFDKTVWLPGTLLERGDRMTMAASIEARMPFMDTELCAYVAGLPASAFVAGGKGKAILRRAMAADLPQEILNKPKSGFRVPLAEWFRGPMREATQARLLDPSSPLAAFTDRAVLQSLWEDHQTGRRNREKELWSLMGLSIFLSQLSTRKGLSQAA